MPRGPLWKPEDEDYLRENYPGMSIKELAQTLGRTESSINNKVKNLGLTNRTYNWWAENEIQYLEKHYGQMPVKKIGDRIGRSESSISHKAQNLGLRNPTFKGKWTDEETRQLISLRSEGLTYMEIAVRMGRAKTTVAKKLHEEGLTRLTGANYILMMAGVEAK